ncbi:alpha/beta fold hydrolase [Streptomyces sp. NPDC055025]
MAILQGHATARRHYRVIAVDLRGMGDSAKPDDGYDKKTMARDIHELLRSLGHEQANIAGDDIGAMVAHAFVARHPRAARKVALCEGVHPSSYIDAMQLVPRPSGSSSWWCAFNQLDGLPEQLLADRYHHVIDHVTQQLAHAPVPSTTRAVPTTPPHTNNPARSVRPTAGIRPSVKTWPTPRNSPTSTCRSLP